MNPFDYNRWLQASIDPGLPVHLPAYAGRYHSYGASPDGHQLAAGYTPVDITSLRGLDAHRSADAELATRLAELHTETAGAPFNDAQREEFETILAQRTDLGAAIEELEIREREVAKALDKPNTERSGQAFALPNIVKVPDNVHDMASYRQRVGSVDELATAYRDGAMRVLETASFPTAKDPDAQRAHIAKVVDKFAREDYGIVSQRIIGTSDPLYQQAFGRYVTGGWPAVTGRHQAALQTYSDSDGGVAIPFTLDPTFILTSDGAVNPMRQISRVEQITGKFWQGVSTAGVTAGYVGESDEASDAAPSDFDDPTITPLRAHVWIKFSAEFAEDFPAGLQAELGNLVQDAKDVLESDKFVMGAGTTEPDGIVKQIITDNSSIVTTITNDVFALADLDKLEGELGPRYRTRAAFVANRAILQLIRSFGTAGQPANSIYDAMSKQLRGYPAYEASAMDDVATDAKEILLLGDFRYFVIVDRIGLSLEFVPQVVGTNGNPTGERGLYARWRNSSKAVNLNAFRLLKVQ